MSLTIQTGAKPALKSELLPSSPKMIKCDGEKDFLEKIKKEGVPQKIFLQHTILDDTIIEELSQHEIRDITFDACTMTSEQAEFFSSSAMKERVEFFKTTIKEADGSTWNLDDIGYLNVGDDKGDIYRPHSRKPLSKESLKNQDGFLKEEFDMRVTAVKNKIEELNERIVYLRKYRRYFEGQVDDKHLKYIHTYKILLFRMIWALTDCMRKYKTHLRKKTFLDQTSALLEIAKRKEDLFNKRSDFFKKRFDPLDKSSKAASTFTVMPSASKEHILKKLNQLSSNTVHVSDSTLTEALLQALSAADKITHVTFQNCPWPNEDVGREFGILAGLKETIEMI